MAQGLRPKNAPVCVACEVCSLLHRWSWNAHHPHTCDPACDGSDRHKEIASFQWFVSLLSRLLFKMQRDKMAGTIGADYSLQVVTRQLVLAAPISLDNMPPFVARCSRSTYS